MVSSHREPVERRTIPAGQPRDTASFFHLIVVFFNFYTIL